MRSIKGVLSRVHAYIALQRVVGADRLRHRCIEELDLSPRETVVDVGCGPAYYLDRLPQPVTYVGFDTEQRYIDWARKRWGDFATFHCEPFHAGHVAELRPVDAVLLLGILHHLSDAEARELLAHTARVLAPTGRVIALDTCFEPSQSRISRWMADNDRGDHVRETSAFADLAKPLFGSVEGEVLAGLTRVPGSYWMMRLTQPRATGAPSPD
jgi:SAM-dependent methyltransferase